MSVRRDEFGPMSDGRAVDRFVLDGHGLSATVISYGASLHSLFVPGRDGALDDVVLGGDTIDAYLDERRFFGAVVGRYANRIGKGYRDASGAFVALPANDGQNCLHGGPAGFDTHVWSLAEFGEDGGPFVELTLDLGEGVDGFPGAVSARARYSIPAPGELTLDLSATVSEPSPVNLSGHSYFNLAGAGCADTILGHVLRVGAETVLPIDGASLPIGGPMDVAGTVFDFRGGGVIGEKMDTADPQIALTGGYDHNFCFSDTGESRLLAQLHAPSSGRTLSIYSDAPGLQFYTGQFLDGSAYGKGGARYGRHAGLCLEPQSWPDSPNHDGFPGVMLPAGATYRHTIRYAFGVQ